MVYKNIENTYMQDQGEDYWQKSGQETDYYVKVFLFFFLFSFLKHEHTKLTTSAVSLSFSVTYKHTHPTTHFKL